MDSDLYKMCACWTTSHQFFNGPHPVVIASNQISSMIRPYMCTNKIPVSGCQAEKKLRVGWYSFMAEKGLPLMSESACLKLYIV